MDRGKGVAQCTDDEEGTPGTPRLKSRISKREKGKGVAQSSGVADDMIEDTLPQNPTFTVTLTTDHLSEKIPLALPIQFVRALMKRLYEESTPMGPNFTVTLTANLICGKTPLLLPAYFVRENILPIGRPRTAQLVVEGEEPFTCPLVWASYSDTNRPVAECYLGYAWKLFCKEYSLFEGLEMDFIIRVVGGRIQFCMFWAVIICRVSS